MEPIICIDCGTELNEGVKFCTNCGHPVTQEPSKGAPEKDLSSRLILESNHKKLKSKKIKSMIMLIFGSITAIYGELAKGAGVMGLIKFQAILLLAQIN